MRERSYELDCRPSEVGALIDAQIIPPLGAIGYVVDGRRAGSITLLGLRRPRWAIALAVFLFPIGLVLLLVKRPREVRIEWDASAGAALEVTSDDRAVLHALTELTGTARSVGVLDKAAAPFAAGACAVLAAWLVGVQLVDTAAGFVVIVFAAALVGSGAGTLIGLRRSTSWDDPPSALAWGAIPALLGALAMAAAFAALVVLLVALGATS